MHQEVLKIDIRPSYSRENTVHKLKLCYLTAIKLEHLAMATIKYLIQIKSKCRVGGIDAKSKFTRLQ